MRILSAPVIALAILTASAAARQAIPAKPDSAAPVVRHGPNIHVSLEDHALPHAEPHIAVSPVDPQTLLGASIVYTHQMHGTTCKTFLSRDRGMRWTTTSFPERYTHGSADPQVAFGRTGTAYFLMLGSGASNATLFYRSSDGGSTWEPARHLKGADHPQVAVDLGTGRHSGRLYISAMHGIRALKVTHSTDDGRSFSEPVPVPNPRKLWQLTLTPIVLRDGTVAIPYMAWDDAGGKSKVMGTTMIELVTTSDGGETFSPPRRVVELPTESFVGWPKDLPQLLVRNVKPVFAADPRTDRLYTAFARAEGGVRRIWLASSADRGRTWTTPLMVDKEAPARSVQYQAILAVNRDGAVAVGWFDTRDGDGDRYALYLAGSTDGGRSFSPPRRVSTALSAPIDDINLAPYPASEPTRGDGLSLRFRPCLGRWGDGGDYMGLVADAAGMFHPLWTDSRDGVFQVWTTGIEVKKANAPDPPIPAGATESDAVTDRISLIVDPPRYSLKTQDAVIPIRLRNTSARAIYAPLRVEVRKAGGWTLLNGETQRGSESRTFDYSPALGDFGVLRPGEVTEAIPWRFRYSGLESAPTLTVVVTGRVEN